MCFTVVYSLFSSRCALSIKSTSVLFKNKTTSFFSRLVLAFNENCLSIQLYKYRSMKLLVDGMEQWIARRTAVPFVMQLHGSSPLQNIRSPKKTSVCLIDWLIDEDCLISQNGWPQLRGCQYNKANYYYYWWIMFVHIIMVMIGISLFVVCVFHFIHNVLWSHVQLIHIFSICPLFSHTIYCLSNVF